MSVDDGGDRKKTIRLKSLWRYNWYDPNSEDETNIREVVKGPFHRPQIIQPSPFAIVSTKNTSVDNHNIVSTQGGIGFKKGIPDPWIEYLALKAVPETKKRISKKDRKLWKDQLDIVKYLRTHHDFALGQGIPDPWKSWPRPNTRTEDIQMLQGDLKETPTFNELKEEIKQYLKKIGRGTGHNMHGFYDKNCPCCYNEALKAKYFCPDSSSTEFPTCETKPLRECRCSVQSMKNKNLCHCCEKKEMIEYKSQKNKNKKRVCRCSYSCCNQTCKPWPPIDICDSCRNPKKDKTCSCTQIIKKVSVAQQTSLPAVQKKKKAKKKVCECGGDLDKYPCYNLNRQCLINYPPQNVFCGPPLITYPVFCQTQLCYCKAVSTEPNCTHSYSCTPPQASFNLACDCCRCKQRNKKTKDKNRSVEGFEIRNTVPAHENEKYSNYQAPQANLNENMVQEEKNRLNDSENIKKKKSKFIKTTKQRSVFPYKPVLDDKPLKVFQTFPPIINLTTMTKESSAGSSQDSIKNETKLQYPNGDRGKQYLPQEINRCLKKEDRNKTKEAYNPEFRARCVCFDNLEYIRKSLFQLLESSECCRCSKSEINKYNTDNGEEKKHFRNMNYIQNSVEYKPQVPEKCRHVLEFEYFRDVDRKEENQFPDGAGYRLQNRRVNSASNIVATPEFEETEDIPNLFFKPSMRLSLSQLRESQTDFPVESNHYYLRTKPCASEKSVEEVKMKREKIGTILTPFYPELSDCVDSSTAHPVMNVLLEGNSSVEPSSHNCPGIKQEIKDSHKTKESEGDEESYNNKDESNKLNSKTNLEKVEDRNYFKEINLAKNYCEDINAGVKCNKIMNTETKEEISVMKNGSENVLNKIYSEECISIINSIGSHNLQISKDNSGKKSENERRISIKTPKERISTRTRKKVKLKSKKKRSRSIRRRQLTDEKQIEYEIDDFEKLSSSDKAKDSLEVIRDSYVRSDASNDRDEVNITFSNSSQFLLSPDLHENRTFILEDVKTHSQNSTDKRSTRLLSSRIDGSQTSFENKNITKLGDCSYKVNKVDNIFNMLMDASVKETNRSMSEVIEVLLTPRKSVDGYKILTNDCIDRAII